MVACVTYKCVLAWLRRGRELARKARQPSRRLSEIARQAFRDCVSWILNQMITLNREERAEKKERRKLQPTYKFCYVYEFLCISVRLSHITTRVAGYLKASDFCFVWNKRFIKLSHTSPYNGLRAKKFSTLWNGQIWYQSTPLGALIRLRHFLSDKKVTPLSFKPPKSPFRPKMATLAAYNPKVWLFCRLKSGAT